MLSMIAVGLVALVMGLLLILSPETLVRASRELNRMVAQMDEQVIRYRVGVGVCLILAALFLFFNAWLRHRLG